MYQHIISDFHIAGDMRAILDLHPCSEVDIPIDIDAFSDIQIQRRTVLIERNELFHRFIIHEEIFRIAEPYDILQFLIRVALVQGVHPLEDAFIVKSQHVAVAPGRRCTYGQSLVVKNLDQIRHIQFALYVIGVQFIDVLEQRLSPKCKHTSIKLRNFNQLALLKCEGIAVVLYLKRFLRRERMDIFALHDADDIPGMFGGIAIDIHCRHPDDPPVIIFFRIAFVLAGEHHHIRQRFPKILPEFLNSSVLQ
ncbi:MAG: hypothetical protein MAGBODY4_00856 [Candidatus Marinimicrobia bacterium]|nr:hypothetical protein [Candidatus Neomarinimicrobiota bacterium]